MKVLVTGAAGFLGHAMVQELLDFGHSVRGLDVRRPTLEPHEQQAFADVQYVLGSVTEQRDCEQALEGVDCVIHCASYVNWRPGTEALLHKVNVDGTKTLFAACVATGVRRFVYTSSVDVVFSGTPITNGTEDSAAIPDKPFDAYSGTKAIAERFVLASNGVDGIATTVIRPVGMYGPRDPYHVGQVLAAAKSGKFVARLGDGSAVFHHVFVRNVAHALRLAAEALESPTSRVAKQVYFITDYPASNFFDFMAPFVEHKGYRMPTLKIPFWLAYFIATLLELLVFLLRPVYLFQPTLTRHSVKILCIPYSFTSQKAAEHFGYRPRWTEQEAMQQTMDWFDTHEPLASS